MQAIKATLAREINKADITEAETLVFEGRILKQTGKQTMEPGEFYFRPTEVYHEVIASWFQRFFLRKRSPLFQSEWVNTVVIACPYCVSPILTPPQLSIERRSPLTVASKIICPYAPDAPHSFKVVEGNIIAA